MSKTTPVEISKSIKVTGKIFAYMAVFALAMSVLLVVLK